MKKIDGFINKYPISKTLRFSLIPVGKTEENFNNACILENDKKRSVEYKKAKKIIDEYHKAFIERKLNEFSYDTKLNKLFIEQLRNYADLYFKNNKTDSEIKAMEESENNMRKYIGDVFSSDKEFKLLFAKEIVKDILPECLNNKEDLSTIEEFQNFFTYFRGFNENRKNIYTSEAHTTGVANRCINENLPKFLDNTSTYRKVIGALDPNDIKAINDLSAELFGVDIDIIFTVDYFVSVLSQGGIDRYNGIIGGYTKESGVKVKGLNECINLYNQIVIKIDKNKKLPLLKMLYKQILSDKESISFIPQSFENDEDVFDSIKECFGSLNETLKELSELFDRFGDYDLDHIYVGSGTAVTDISNAVFNDWSAVRQGWNAKYEKTHPLKDIKRSDKYFEQRDKEYKKSLSFSISDLQEFGESDNCKNLISDFYKDKVVTFVNDVQKKYNAYVEFISVTEDTSSKKLCFNYDAIKVIKELLDGVKELERIIKPLMGSGKEEIKDELFYGEFLPCINAFSTIDALYDKVRNYVTKKPYSTEKIKLNFDNPQLLAGWDKNKERDYRTVLLRKDNNYYLAIMDKSNNKIFLDPPECNSESFYQKIEYKLLPGPNKMLPKVFFAESNLDRFKPNSKIMSIREKESFKKGKNFNLKDCHEFIDFFKESIEKHEDWSQFGFEFSPTETYNDISEFYNEVKEQGYSIKIKNIPESYISEMVESGQLYLFRIYNKDFSDHSHGKPNLHTMYFKMLFDEENLKDVVYKLDGEAEMFYREPSINEDELTIHNANEKLANKNKLRKKEMSVFPYDIIKDRRYTKRQFSLHIPITLNFKADGKKSINDEVRKAVKDCGKNYVIGIDRGERNLLYVCVIDNNGDIVLQKSLNMITSSNDTTVDYHHLLSKIEEDRQDARKNWGAIQNIKELKEGYLSQVVHEIYKLVLKYDAIIAMEDLNFGFKKGRFNVEKQVYQKFENMLIEKLNYLVSKDADINENGGLLKAYQLTNKVEGVNKGKQNGFIFYVPAWLTSKIDPVTGFADLIKPKYSSKKDSLEFINKIDAIRYNCNPENEYFEFDIDLSKFPGTNASYKKEWTICTFGERIINYRNKDKNSAWDSKTIVLTTEFKNLFDRYNIDYMKNDLKESILNQSSEEFFKSFIALFANTLQLRNSETGNTDLDYLISPVKDKDGVFYDSRNYPEYCSRLPGNADANGAYNIARKALWAIEKIKETDDDKLKNVNLAITNAEWLEWVQK
ncbi:MAG: type V CRISPR-associated protein Cpf1 [Ruminococcaceae bacterium]|nr:type V CRISPR-associated protein Cpf1 [Oscillospiraceae bacterium]